MIAERKALRNQNVSFMAVTYYSVFTVIISIFQVFYARTFPAIDQINLSASIVVLVASLVASGFRLEARAASFRECYLKLQKLYDQDLPESEKKAYYRDLLLDFPNHTPRDYQDLLVNHILFEKKKLTNGDNELEYTKFMAASFFMRSTAYWIMMVILFGSPLIFLIWPLLGSWC